MSQENNFVPQQKEYKKLRPFPLFMKNNFPFIENTFESLDYYGLLCEVVKYLNCVIENEHIVMDNQQAVYDAFVELNNYVSTYFDNLDVQEEINNKLDEMVLDGTLENIIGMYITNSIIRTVDTVIEMKSMTTLENGMKIKTLGYYNINDGGNGYYSIKNQEENETFDESFKIELENDLKAELIIENDKVNFITIGGRTQNISDNTLYDNKTILQNFVNYNENSIRKLTLFIPGGVYGFSETNIASTKGFNIEGVYSYSQWKWNGTIFVPMTSNQSHIIKIGNTTMQSCNISMKNIVFSSAIFEYNEDIKTYRVHSTGIPGNPGKITSNDIKLITSCLDIIYLAYSKFENIDFQYILGTAFSMSTSWEIDFDKLNFRFIENYSGSIINMLQNDSTLHEYPNITACNFKQINAEAIIGNLINISSGCSFANNTFELINVEPNLRAVCFNDEVINALPDVNFDETTAIHFSIFHITGGAQFSDICINNIQCNNFPIAYLSYMSQNYLMDRIITQESSNSRIDYIVNNTSIVGQNKDIDILYFNGGNFRHYQHCIFNNYSSNNQSDYVGRFNVKGARNIKCNEVLNKLIPSNFLYLGNYTPIYDVLRNSTDRAFGNLYYDNDSINPLKLVYKVINTVENPNINRQEVRYPLIGNTLLLRVKIPNGLTSRLVATIYNEEGQSQGGVGAAQFPDTVGDGKYHWYAMDLSSVVSTVKAGYNVTLNQPNDYDVSPFIDVISSC